MFYRIACCLMVAWLISASEEQSCPEPPLVDNSVFVAREVEGQTLGAYFCIKGYHLVGEEVFFCNASKEWNISTPECRLGHCPDPVLENGEFNSSGPVNLNDKIAFKCTDHYILRGSSWSQCLEDHTWEPPLPICTSRDCDDPRSPVHGYFEGENFTLGSIITYHCEEGYRLVGRSEQQCIDGEWSHPLPVCKRIPEGPKQALPTGLEKALLAFQENEDLCSAIENFMKRIKDSGLTVEEAKCSLERKKAELEAKILKHPS